MSKRLSYAVDNAEEKRKMIASFRNQSRNWSKIDKEYYNNMKNIMRESELHTVDDCIRFYLEWFNIYSDVRSYWEEPID